MRRPWKTEKQKEKQKKERRKEQQKHQNKRRAKEIIIIIIKNGRKSLKINQSTVTHKHTARQSERKREGE